MLLAVATLLTPLLAADTPGPPPDAGGQVVVANRAAGTITVIDVASDTVAQTIALQGGNAFPEPMYVEPAAGLLFVGDRANDRVVAYDPATWLLVGEVPVGAGVFHMKSDPFEETLWVVNDVDGTLSIVDPAGLVAVGVTPIPADLAAMGGKPHDVVVDKHFAYVSIVGLAGESDYVVQFRRSDLAEHGRRAVGKDPHLVLRQQNPHLFVPTQGGNAVTVLRRFGLAPVAEVAVPGAHGAWMAGNGGVLYTTNLPGGGVGGLVTLDARTHAVLGVTDTPYATPHNIASSPSGEKVYVTHSGATADKVSVYACAGNALVPELQGEVTVGLNPFGITYVP